jgi:hypothetical protein
MLGKSKFMVALLVLFASCSSYGASTNPQASGSAENQPPAEELVRFDRFMGLVKQLRSSLDRTQFDLDALLSSLDYDDMAIVEFVKTQVRFEPYSGSLRGAIGTLRSRAGNSLDQSVLLATLLNNAGFEARIVRGDLPVDAVRHLIFDALTSSVGRPPIGDVQAIENTIKEIEELYEGSDSDAFGLVGQRLGSESSSLNPRSRVHHHLDVVLKSLESHGISLNHERSVEPLIQQMTDYFWVEYRVGPADSWSSIHPAYRESSPLVASLIVKSTFSESVPQDLVHRVKIEAFMKRNHGLKEETISVAGPWEQPAANLGSVPISYTNFPLALAHMRDWTDPVYQATYENPFEDLYKEAMQEHTFFAPMLNGQLAPAAQFFDLAGNVVPPEVAASTMASMFQTLGEKADKVTGALANLGLAADSADTTTRMLVEQWLEITLIRPGEQDKRIRRQLIAAPFEAKEKYVGLGQEVTFTVETGGLPESYFIDSLLGELETLESSFRGLLQPRDEVDNGQTSFDETRKTENEPKPIGDLLFYLMADQAKEFVNQVYVFRSEPSIVARYRNVWLQDAEYQGFDVVNNTRRALKIGVDGILYAPTEAAIFGIWETLAETFVNPIGRAGGFNTIAAFETSEVLFEDDFPVVVGPEELSSDALTFDANVFLRSDRANGFTVILPARSSATEPPNAWWRVNTETGETLGMLGVGWGGVMWEAVLMHLRATVYVGTAKGVRAGLTCSFILAAGGVVAAVGTGNLDAALPILSHKLVPVVGYGVASAIQLIAVMPSGKEAFLMACFKALTKF